MTMRSGAQTLTNFQEQVWALPAGQVLRQLKVEAQQGLTEKEVQRRRKTFGHNQLKEHQVRSWGIILAAQFKNIIIGLLAAAAAIAFIYGEWIEGWAILVVIVINTLIGFFTEMGAVRSMEALYKLGTVKTRVRRNGRVLEIDASELVPGDIVVIEGGDIITADLRIISGSKLQADESVLTGESLPVRKSLDDIEAETVLAERTNMLFKGTSITRGAGEAVVLFTGLNTELGKISSLVEATDDEKTPLEARLDALGYKLIIITLLIVVVIVVSGVLTGRSFFLMVETGIALAVAAIPEGLPIVATISLARGLQTMARKNALVNRLSSVETLGATDIICTDKTGTLTENKMSVEGFHLYHRTIDLDDHDFIENDTQIQPDKDKGLMRALQIGVLCNNASLSQKVKKGVGDPLEIALLEAGRKAGIEFEALSTTYPEVKESAFDADIKMMATWNRWDQQNYQVHVKGAPTEVFQHCTHYLHDAEAQPFTKEAREYFTSQNQKLASHGLRMLGLATKLVDNIDDEPYNGLCFVGLVTLFDPPRKQVHQALSDCQEAGIRIVMMTGDQVETARFIANEVGLGDFEDEHIIHSQDLENVSEGQKNEAAIFARINPKQKLDLIEMYQQKGHIVAMTGDGVNDAPALKKADIGIAMGKRGTQVAREAADIVLMDDQFSTIVTAVEQGRVIFMNIRKFVLYLISCNVSEIMVVGLASFIGMTLPILPLQILFLNLVTDVFPALALGMGKGEPNIMKEKPRAAEEGILNRANWISIIWYGAAITGAVLGAFFWGIHLEGFHPSEAVTLSFLTLAFAQLWHVFNMRDLHSGFFLNDITKNKWVWLALVLCIALLLGAVYVPDLASVLKLVPLSLAEWNIVVVMSLLPLITAQIYQIVNHYLLRRDNL